MMQPPPTTVEPIVVNLSPPEVKVAAGGEPVEIIANVRNASNTVDQYSIEIENLDPSWYTIMVQSVSLFPGDSAPIPIRIHPPKGSNTRAGQHTFAVRARSYADPSMIGVTKGSVVVSSYSIFTIELAPKRVTGTRGKFRLSIANGGNSDTQLELTGRDPEAGLNYSFSPSAPSVPPGQKKVVPVTVRRKGFRLVGEAEKYQFVLNARPVDGTEKEAKEVQGEFVFTPRFRTWKWPILMLVIPLLLAAWIIFKPDVNPCSARFFLLPSNLQFYSSFLCSGGVVSIGKAETRESGPNPCVSGAGFTEVRKKYNDLVGGCVEDEWYDELGNAHQATANGQLLYVLKATGQANIYFIKKDGTMYTFVNCDPPGTFNNCDVVEVKKEKQ